MHDASWTYRTFLADIIASISSKNITDGCSLRASENKARMSFSPSPYSCRNSENMYKYKRECKHQYEYSYEYEYEWYYIMITDVNTHVNKNTNINTFVNMVMRM